MLTAGMEKEAVPSGISLTKLLSGHCTRPFGSAASRIPITYFAFAVGVPPDHITVFAALEFQVSPGAGADTVG
jgi:hypothetical protein